MLVSKVRLRFAKRGDLRLVSHHDLMRCLERMFRRAALPMAYSQGFNPRPRYVLPLALGLGIEGRREMLELELVEPMEPAEVLRRLQATAPPGLDFLEAAAAAPGRSPRVVAAQYTLEVPPAPRDAARAALAVFLASDHWPYQRQRPDRTVEADLRPFVLSGELDPAGTLRIRMRIAPDGSARPEEAPRGPRPAARPRTRRRPGTDGNRTGMKHCHLSLITCHWAPKTLLKYPPSIVRVERPLACRFRGVRCADRPGNARSAQRTLRR